MNGTFWLKEEEKSPRKKTIPNYGKNEEST